MENKYKTTIEYIMLTGISGLGPVGQHKLLETLGSIDACFELDEEVLLSVSQDGWYKHFATLLAEGRKMPGIMELAERQAERCAGSGIGIVTFDDDEYPARMRDIPGMPKILYCKGSLKINNFARSVGIVGARRCTKEGKASAIRIAAEAVKNGSCVISGMAKGIDSYAHTACLKSQAYTIAVLGCGPDLCYPKEHESLYESIAERGCILSQFPPGTLPHRYMFPVRNSLIAGLSDELYVIDAGRNSGTKSTVKAAEKYERTVYIK